jgi:ATP-dependent Clp protease ATP-binding subunit ClpX
MRLNSAKVRIDRMFQSLADFVRQLSNPFANEKSCSFCRKPKSDERPLVEGPGSVWICEECVTLCQEILKVDRERSNPRRSAGDGPA